MSIKPQLSYEEHIMLGQKIRELKSDAFAIRDILQKAYGKTHKTIEPTKEIDYQIEELRNMLDTIVHELVPLEDKERKPHLCYFGNNSELLEKQ